MDRGRPILRQTRLQAGVSAAGSRIVSRLETEDKVSLMVPTIDPVAADTRIDAFHDLLSTLGGALDVRDVFQRLSEVVARIISHDEANLALLTEDGARFRLYASTKHGVWFNRGASQQVPSSLLDSALGNATRNNPTLRNPAVFSEDISLQKEVPVTERWRISLRFEAFNLLNRVRWNNPDSTYTSSTFGLVRSQANNPRQMQAGLKVLF